MKEFEYVITDEVGIHARPAGLIVNKAKEFTSNVAIKRADGKVADGKRLFNIMSLQIKKNDKIVVSADGLDEEQCIAALKEAFEANL